MTIVFFVLGGALSVSTLVAFDQYRESQRLQKRLEELENVKDISTESNS